MTIRQQTYNPNTILYAADIQATADNGVVEVSAVAELEGGKRGKTSFSVKRITTFTSGSKKDLEHLERLGRFLAVPLVAVSTKQLGASKTSLRITTAQDNVTKSTSLKRTLNPQN